MAPGYVTPENDTMPAASERKRGPSPALLALAAESQARQQEALASSSLLSWVLPNGKTMGESTGEECAVWGEFFTALGAVVQMIESDEGAKV